MIHICNDIDLVTLSIPQIAYSPLKNQNSYQNNHFNGDSFKENRGSWKKIEQKRILVVSVHPTSEYLEKNLYFRNSCHKNREFFSQKREFFSTGNDVESSSENNV